MINFQGELTDSLAKNTSRIEALHKDMYTPVYLFQPLHQFGHPKDYLFIAELSMYNGSNKPKNMHVFTSKTNH